MMSYEEVIALAKKNTEEQGLLVAKMRRELDRREAHARKEMEEERIEYQKQKALEAAEEKRNPKPLKISRVRYAEMQAEARAKRESADSQKATSSTQEVYPTLSSTQAPASKSYPERKPFSLESRVTTGFTGKTGVSSYDEVKKTLEARKPTPRSKVGPSTGFLNTKSDSTVQKMTLTPKKIKSQLRDSIPKRVTPASPLSLRKKVLPSNQASPPVSKVKASQPVPKHQASIPASSKRPLATEGKLNSSGLSGSRFAKYGPLEDEPPHKSVKSSASSRPIRSPTHYPSKSSELSDTKAKSKASSNDRVILPVKSSQTRLERVRSDSDRVRTSERERMHSADSLRHRSSEHAASKSSRPINRESRKPHLESPLPQRSSESRRQPFDSKEEVIDEDYAKKNISSIIGNLFGYDRTKYRDDLSDDDMEVSASRVRAEESRSARLGRLEDEREEALERQRLLRLRQKKGSR